MRSRTLAASAAICLGLTATSGCAGQVSSSGNSDDESCTFTIEFGGRAYTAAAAEGDVERGRKLGTASVTPCGDDVDGPAGEEVTVYAVVGTPQSEAVFGTPNVGLMRPSNFAEDH